jgi:lipopolysaccharide transport system ATP-binding protein
MAEVLIVESVSKRFKIHRNRPVTLKEFIIRGLKGRNDNRTTILWALRDVSFSVGQGRTLGIIGHNGAGKSTLLRLVCGLGRPTRGEIRRMGHVGSLLELGSGFNPEMSGRENLITGGILSGLTRRQVKASQDEIISFAELEEFIDQPVRTYSTGMYLRLAFATAMHFDPDFLVIDEVLAVGDSRFQEKCQKRLNAFRVAGKSLILVSHDLEQVRSLCDEVLVLEEGQVVMQGEPERAINCYHDLMRQRTENRVAQLDVVGHPLSPVEQGRRMGTQEATIRSVNLFDGENRITDRLSDGSSLTIEIEYLLQKPLSDMALTLGIFNETNTKCFETNIPSTKEAFGRLAETGILRCHLPALPLLPGRYYITVGLFPADWSFVYDYHWQMHPLNVWNEKELPAHITGVVSVRPNWSIRLMD